MSACVGGGPGGGTVPVTCYMRRRAAAEDTGADAGDASWAAAPVLYDFSQQQPRLPSPAVAAPCSPRRQLSASPPAARRSPSRSPSPDGPCLLLALQRTCLGWGTTRRVEYHPARHQAPVPAPCEAEEDDGSVSDRAGKRACLEEEEVGKVDDEAAAAGEGKPEKVKKRKARGRNWARWTGRPRGAARRAKKAPRAVKELKEEDEAPGESGRDVKPVVVVERRNRKRAPTCARPRSPDAVKRAKKEKEVVMEKAEAEEKSKPTAAAPPFSLAPAPAPDPGSPRGKVDRWAACRYAAGEAALLGILRAGGATAAKPMPRADLRALTRRHIGDTGLLDHLLRHVADKVPAGSDERVRRRYNPAGGLEYWLEPAGWAAVRREAGVDDPYWVPPPGWKLGDPVSPEARALEVQKQVDELAGELDAVKRQMKQLDSNLVQVSKEAYISWKGYDCMAKANVKLEKEVLSLEEKYENATQVNGELKELLLLLKDKYETVLEKNEKLEGQMVALSASFKSMKEELLLQRIGEQPMLMLAQEPWDADKQEASAVDAAAAGLGNQLAEAAAEAVDGSFSSNSGSCGDGKSALRKYSVRVCRRDGMLEWPSAASGGTPSSPRELPEPLTPGGDLDLVVTDFDAVINSLAPPSMEEYLLADGLPTPTSASSSTNASPKLPLLPAPASPVQVQTPSQSPSNVAMDDLQAVQPSSSGLNLQLRRMDKSSSSSSGHCGAKAMKLDAGAGGGGGGNVGTELVLATPTY
ncbi:hypothetical protein BS78_08G154300 [Paspalum vaginatum]|nr:hypothetical protein BS78_08G154300 [Paspalum vaginatum]